MRADVNAPAILGMIVMLALAAPASAEPAVVWTIAKNKGLTTLLGMLDESEVDAEFWARCRRDGLIDIGMGAESHVGKGKGEKVSLTLVSGGKSVTVDGVSRESENVEMTGGIELQARVKRDHALFGVLATGQPIVVTGPLEHGKLTWQVKGLRSKVSAFLAACGKKG